MTEARQVCSRLRDALMPFGVVQRIESPLTGLGIPDVSYCLLGVAGVVECKVIPASGRCPSNFTLDQLMWGEAWARVGGLWHLVGLMESPVPVWVVMDASGARRWFDGGGALICAAYCRSCPDGAGRGFPTRQVLDLLAPPDRRRVEAKG